MISVRVCIRVYHLNEICYGVYIAKDYNFVRIRIYVYVLQLLRCTFIIIVVVIVA